MGDATTNEEVKVGREISSRNKKRIQEAHDTLAELGAECKAPEAAESTTIGMEEFAGWPEKGNALKAISRTDDELRVGNYIVLFGGRDLTGFVNRKNDDGSAGEYFTETTDLESSYTKTGRIYVDWEHGFDPDNVGINDDDVLGYVDWKTAIKDKRGVFVERVLNRRNEYVQWLEELIDAGLVGNSSEAVGRQVVKKANGEIARWPIRRDSLTVNPMEPRMLTENQIQAAKALADKLPALKSLIPAEPQAEEAAPAVEAVEETVIPDPIGEVVKMEITDEKFDEAMKLAGEAGAVAALKAMPANATPGLSVVRDEADVPFKSIGDQLAAVKQATLTQGRELAPRLKALNIKALGANELIGSEGGFLLEPSFVAGLLTPLHDTGPFSSRVAKLAIGPNANGAIIRAIDETNRATGSRWGGIQGYRLAEGGTKLASSPTLKFIEMRLKKYAVLCYATEELLQDTTALAGIIQQGAAEELDFMVNDDILNGLGVAGPLGIMNSGALVSVSKEAGQGADTVVTQNIFKMWARMHPRSKSNAVWFINTDVTPQLYQLALSVGTGGMPMYMTPGSLPQAPSGALLGRPVVETEFNATLGDKGDIVLADMSQYAMIDRDVQAASSIHVQFLTDQVAYRFVYRCDGQPKISAPLTPYKGTGNTLSPFVTLDARA